MDYPALLDSEHIATTRQLFPADAIARAQAYLAASTSLGAYSHSKGMIDPIVAFLTCGRCAEGP